MNRYWNNLILIIIIISLLKCSETKQVLITGHPFDDPQENDVHGPHNKVTERFHLIFPGTKWCGPGDIANGYHDLGKYQETDMCCRDHDHCENIPGGGEKYGLKNDDLFTRLHCDCDKKFFYCLHNSNETVSGIIGRQYFFFRNLCYKESYPVDECVQYQSRVFVKRCIKYRFNVSEAKRYQWFDLPLYDIESYPEDLNFINDIDDFYSKQARNQELINARNVLN